MNIQSIFKKTAAIIGVSFVAAVAVIGMSGRAHAAQIPVVPGEPLPSIQNPVFNTYTNVPNGIGDEADFVRLRPSNGDPTRGGESISWYTDELDEICTVGAKYDVRTYVHNGADDDFNDNGAGSAVAHNVRLAMTAPLNTTAKTFQFNSTVTAENAATVTDGGTLNCQNKVQLKLVANTVKVYSRSLGWNGIGDSAVNGQIKLGSRVIGSGDVWGCWDETVYVVYTVEVVEAPEVPTPEYTCDLLSLTLIKDKKYRLTVTATAKNGATVKEYRYHFGDNTETVVSENNTVEHDYKIAGTYNPIAKVTFNLPNGTTETVVGQNCNKVLKIEKDVEMCDVPGKGHLPKNDPACKPDVVIEKCTIPGKTNLPKGDANCKEVKGATTLPNTGAGSIAGLMAGVTAAGTALHRRFTLKRNK